VSRHIRVHADASSMALSRPNASNVRLPAGGDGHHAFNRHPRDRQPFQPERLRDKRGAFTCGGMRWVIIITASRFAMHRLSFVSLWPRFSPLHGRLHLPEHVPFDLASSPREGNLSSQRRRRVPKVVPHLSRYHRFYSAVLPSADVVLLAFRSTRS
jgi:hypothetical protein